MKVYRGDVYYCDFGHINVLGSEQRGIRPVLIVQNDVANEFSTTVVVVPLTSKLKKAYLPSHVLLEEYIFLERGMVLTEQLKTIDKTRLLGYVVSLSENDMNKVTEALKSTLSII